MKKLACLLAILIAAFVLFMQGMHRFGSYYVQIPIDKLNAYQIPCTSIEIDGHKYQVEIDLGAKTALSLRQDILTVMQKEPCGTSRRIDFRGNQYETAAYLLPKAKIGALVLRHIKVKEESTHFATQGAIVVDANETPNAGRIGRDCFAGKNLFMDFQHHKFIACSHLKDIVRADTSYTATPFKNTPDGIILEVDTDLGKQQFLLDTGSTISALRSDQNKERCNPEHNSMPVMETALFAINGTNFGLRQLYLLDISPTFQNIDGLLGMDFLKEHWLYLDFTTATAYIGNSSKECDR